MYVHVAIFEGLSILSGDSYSREPGPSLKGLSKALGKALHMANNIPFVHPPGQAALKLHRPPFEILPCNFKASFGQLKLPYLFSSQTDSEYMYTS